MQDISSQLKTTATLGAIIRRAARRRRVAGMLWCLGWVLLALAGISAVLGDRVSEPAACRMLVCGMLAGAVVLFGGCFWLKRRQSIRALSREYQRECPQDHDRLEAALELETASERTAFQQEYLEELRQRYLADGGKALLEHDAWQPQWRPLTLGLMLLCIAGLAFLGRGAWERCWMGIFGKEAILLANQPAKVPVHQDMTIAASIQRYGTEGGVFLESIQGDRHAREAMSCGVDGKWRLTLYDLTEETRYRVVTKNAASSWQNFTVYVPPAPTAVQITTRPPEYTGLEQRTYTDFQDLDLVEGELLTITCEMPEGQSWELVEGADGAFVRQPPVEFFPRTQCVYTPRFHQDDVSADGIAFRTMVRPDQAPVIELVAPQEDGEVAPNTRPALVAMTSDDYGVSEISLHYVIDDGDEVAKVIWSEAPQKNVDLDQNMDFGELEGGQVITGWLEARDNCQPDAHSARSSLFFLTVIPPEDEMPTADGEGQSGGQENQEMTVEDLIAESKRLLRGTQDAQERRGYITPALALQEQHELSRDLRSLGVAVTGRQVVVAKNAGVAELPPEMAQFFDNAARALEEAGDLAETGELMASRKPQQRALTQLTRLAWMLLQNARQMAQKGQSGQSSEQSGDQKESQDGSQSQKGDRNFDLQKLQQALNDVQQLRREEEQLLSDFKASDAPAERRLASRAGQIAEEVSSVASAASAVPPIREAAREMVDAAGQLEGGEVPNARLRGERSVQALTTAEALLQEALRKESLEQMERLARKADELAQEQRQQARKSEKLGKSGGAGSEEKKAARDAQSALQEKSQRFREEAAASLQHLSRQFPQAADALTNAMRSSAADEVQKAQQKAQNALLYGRFDRATASQDRAADALEQWRDQLSEAGEQIPQYTPEELQQALEELQELASQLAQAQSAQSQSQAQQTAGQAMRAYGEMFRSSELSQLGEVAANGSPQEAFDALETARAFLRDELAKMLGEDAVRNAHQSVPMPKKYRPQSQEYFRRLGE